MRDAEDVDTDLIMVGVINAFLDQCSLFNMLLYDSLALQRVLRTRTQAHTHACTHAPTNSID